MQLKIGKFDAIDTVSNRITRRATVLFASQDDKMSVMYSGVLFGTCVWHQVDSLLDDDHGIERSSVNNANNVIRSSTVIMFLDDRVSITARVPEIDTIDF